MTEDNNIDLGELEKFSAKADQWWEPEGEFKILHDINPTRLSFIKQHTALNNARLLDIGCGGGILAEAMAQQGAIVTGLDASKENIASAHQHATDNNINIDYVVNTAEFFAQDHASYFDVITCMELLEHVPYPISIIEACRNMIKPGGHVIFSTLNRNIKTYLFAVLAGEYLLQRLPKGTHRYEKFIRPSELFTWCKDNSLEMNDLAGMQYNPFSGHCSLNTRPDVNYLLDTIATTHT